LNIRGLEIIIYFHYHHVAQLFIDPNISKEQRYKYVTYGHGRKGYLRQYGVRVWLL